MIGIQAIADTKKTVVGNEIKAVSYPTDAKHFAEILDYFSLKYEVKDYYLHVGQIKQIQGWILHLSIVLSEIYALLEAVIPYLVAHSLPFKIIMDVSVGDDVLNGNFGVHQIGKVVSLYPETDNAALIHAAALIELSRRFRGPAIPTDFHLGAIVYTRYGAHSPIIMPDATGNKEKFIYDNNGHLTIDTYSIPFKMPAGTKWPFESLAKLQRIKPNAALKGIYKPIALLKPDPRGSVFKGIYLKSLMHVKSCLIKQGLDNMASDKSGRTISDRLAWQNELYHELRSSVPMPQCVDLFQEGGATYLIMEFIKGNSLLQVVENLNYLSKSWPELEQSIAVNIMHYLIDLTIIIKRLHESGFVHRDIVPLNFMIDRKGRIFLIDLELVYSPKWQKPIPPFSLGTAGFMSPEQQNIELPTDKEDIYGLGATLLMILTGLTPRRFDITERKSFKKTLQLLIGNEAIANLIISCLEDQSNKRPEISEVLKTLTEYQQMLKKTVKNSKNAPFKTSIDARDLANCIQSAIMGLSQGPTVSLDNIWYSKRRDSEFSNDPRYKIHSKYIGIQEGVSGPLYVLARLKKANINIDACLKNYYASWKYINEENSADIKAFSPGLYHGAAGVALAFSEGIASGLIENTQVNRAKIHEFLALKNEKLSIPEGIAGQGITSLRCKSLLQFEESNRISNSIANQLLLTQNKSGGWSEVINSGHGGSSKRVDLSPTAASSIVWYLFDYAFVQQNSQIYSAAEKGLIAVVSNPITRRSLSEYLAIRSWYQSGQSGTNELLMLLKAYELGGEIKYKLLIEQALSKFPFTVANNNFAQLNGLSGLGELYLEAYRILKNDELKERADWIATFFLTLLKKNKDGSGFWITDETSPPTADLLVGNSGIIHFLARHLHPENIGYLILQ